MTSNTQYVPKEQLAGTTGNVGATFAFDKINEPGTYVCNWSGHLLRVPEDGIMTGRSPLITILGQEPLWVTKICDNPYVPITKARLLACSFDLNVNF